jgi:hypothetical protein
MEDAKKQGYGEAHKEVSRAKNGRRKEVGIWRGTQRIETQMRMTEENAGKDDDRIL